MKSKSGTTSRRPRPIGDSTLKRYAHQWGATGIPFADDHPEVNEEEHPQIREALGHLNQSVALRSLMLLTGPNGVGKSHLLSRWRDQLEPRHYHPIAVTQASLSQAGLLSYLARKLGKPGGNRSTLLMHLEEALSELGETTAVIILDEAQNYSHGALEEIRLLLGMDLSQSAAFSLVLAGDDYLLGGLKLRSHRALYTRIACHHRLEEWDEKQIKALLGSSQAAVEISDCLDPEAMKLILQACGGLPRTALQIARAGWIRASEEKAGGITAQHIQAIMATIPAVSDGARPSPT